MYKIIFTSLTCFMLTYKFLFGQFGNIDTSHVLLSAPMFDYKNPQFDKTGSSINYSIKDCMFAYEQWSLQGDSKIIVRFMKYDSLGPEAHLTDHGSYNINPAVAYYIDQFPQPENNRGAVVFQSDRNGNWDIYFSYYNMVFWNTAIPIASSASDEVTPSITSYLSGSNLNFLVSYKKGNDICLRHFYNGNWMNEINVTEDDSIECFSPQLTRAVFSQNNLHLAYQRRIDGLRNSISFHRILIVSGGNLDISQRQIIFQPNSQDNIRFSNGINSSVLNYDYDTLGTKNFYSADIKFNNYTLYNWTGYFGGDNYGGTGSSHGDITSDFPEYSLLSWLREINDSTQVVISQHWENSIRKFYVGDDNSNSFVNTSSKLVHGNKFRVRILWEKQVNGKTALIESFRDDYLTSITQSSSITPEGYFLSQNYPNPFNPVTKIKFDITRVARRETQDVKIIVSDIAGREVSILVNEKLSAGSYEVEFDGSSLPSGIYFYKLLAGDFSETRRMILLK